MDEKETARLEAFSDGVFAVAITLLVLNIKIPPDNFLDDLHLRGELLGQWPMLLAFVTSFATIGVMWINHHRLFNHIKRANTRLLLQNLRRWVMMVFVPVPTVSLAQQYAVHPDQNRAARMYSG